MRNLTYSTDEPGWFSRERIEGMARLAARGKRGAVDVANFLLDPHRHIYPLREELLSRSYQPSVPRGFLLHEPKPRLISALPFRDRVVQHLLIGACLPAFERWYAPQSYACRVGKGTHRALEAATRWFRSFPWVLRLDLAKFFPSIDHEVLRRQIDPRTPPELRWLAHRILATPGVVEPVAFHFPGDDLFAPHQRPHGLPIGNLTSQIWANAMLTPIDHLIASHLGLGTFVRYCDDLLLFAHDPGKLREAWCQIEERCWSLRLRLHPVKCRLHRTSDPVPFLGFVLCRSGEGVRVRLRSENARRFRRRLRRDLRLYRAGALEAEEVLTRVRSWLAHARHGHTRSLCRTELERISLSSPGHRDHPPGDGKGEEKP